jgi:hypothetical protein
VKIIHLYTTCVVTLLTRKYDHISGHIRAMHWLPLKARITFKIVLLTFKALNRLAPTYISELLREKESTRCMRSNDNQLLVVPSTRLKNCGDRAFSKAAPALWNELPLSIRTAQSVSSFKSNLKTFLFKKHCQ